METSENVYKDWEGEETVAVHHYWTTRSWIAVHES